MENRVRQGRGAAAREKTKVWTAAPSVLLPGVAGGFKPLDLGARET